MVRHDKIQDYLNDRLDAKESAAVEVCISRDPRSFIAAVALKNCGDTVPVIDAVPDEWIQLLNELAPSRGRRLTDCSPLVLNRTVRICNLRLGQPLLDSAARSLYGFGP